jgi:hypothetical protein
MGSQTKSGPGRVAHFVRHLWHLMHGAGSCCEALPGVLSRAAAAAAACAAKLARCCMQRRLRARCRGAWVWAVSGCVLPCPCAWLPAPDTERKCMSERAPPGRALVLLSGGGRLSSRQSPPAYVAAVARREALRSRRPTRSRCRSPRAARDLEHARLTASSQIRRSKAPSCRRARSRSPRAARVRRACRGALPTAPGPGIFKGSCRSTTWPSPPLRRGWGRTS